ncbi:hypothetical protein KZI27_05005 [Curtobacterium sp. TC1]|uniref:hypothetical protein n=1 Tax=Curtobacterium sp. TC1 TaxID=2862880 RepID=UPI001C9A8F69|nr:hypothetical protein [Curtobacterium sp. TC1]QZQ56205.1 hypothetical protein KZI27_05005 [Curtobacterium sp. TC1]
MTHSKDTESCRPELLLAFGQQAAAGAALFESGIEKLTVEEHDRRNAFNRLAEIDELRLIA